jgi:hypothetical protein
MTGDAQSPEEMAARIADGSAGEFVKAWADVVLNHRDWAPAMRVATPQLRLATAQQFVLGAPQVGISQVAAWDRDVLANELAEVDTANPFWDVYAAAFLGSFEAFRGTRLAVGTRQRPIDIDHARVVLIDYDNSPHETRVVDGQELKYRPADQPVVGRPLVVRRVQDSWLLASYGEDLPRPGWPPFLG